MIHTRSGRECSVLSLAFVSFLAAACTTPVSQVLPDGSVGSGGVAGKAGSGGKGGAGGTAGKAGSGGQAGGGGIAGATGSGGGQAGSGGLAVGSGGSGSGGSGSGGTMGPPVPFGAKPTTYSPADAQAAYDAWKAKHLINCNNGKYRVAWEDAKADATVSEGIGYGMLLTVAYNDQAAFNGLWAYYQAAKDGNGLMNWLRYGCDVSRQLTYSQYPDGAATDADLDAAMALIMANCRWGGGTYASDAATLITAIKNSEVVTDNGRLVLQGGDSAWFDNTNNSGPVSCLNPSYFAPAYYRAFANFVTNATDKAFWNQLATDTYTTLANGQNTTSGLVRNWTNAAGGSSACASSYNCADSFGDDAVRTPWRIATDYVWYGTPAAKTFLDRMTGWAKNTVGIGNLGTWYNLDGSAKTPACTASGRVISVGSFACAAMAYDQTTVNAFAAEMKNISDPNYFERTLRALYSLLLTGQFTTCGNKP